MMQRPVLAGLAGVALLALTGALASLGRGRAAGAQGLVERIPASATAVIGVDVGGLRRLGLLDRLAGPRSLESAEYRRFVADTAFDYRKDLDYVVAGLSGKGNYFVLRGRFDWPALERYAKSSGGACDAGVCRVRTDSGKIVSFRLAEAGVLELATGPLLTGGKNFLPLPALAWAVLDEPPALLAGASKVRLTLQAGTGGFVLRLLADCPDETVPPALAARLERLLSQLRANPQEGVVAARKQEVELTWQVNPSLLAALDAGLSD